MKQLLSILRMLLGFLACNAQILLRIVYQRRVLAAVLLITAFGAALRIYKITEWSYWDDEVYTIRDAFGLTSPDEKNFFPDYPISYWFARISIDYWGITPGAVRFFPCLFGIITIPTLFLVSRRFFGTAPALMAALLLAVNHWHLYQSQNARGYTLLVLLSMLSLWSYFIGLERNKMWMWAASFVFFLLALLTQYVAGFVLIVMLAYPLALRILKRLHGFEYPPGMNRFYFAVIVFILLAGIFAVAAQSRDIAERLENGLYSFGRRINNPIHSLGSISWNVTMPLLLLGVFGILDPLRRRERAAVFFGLAVAIPFGTLVVLSLTMPAWPRYGMISLPVLCLLAGCFIDRFAVQRRSYTLAAAILAIAIGQCALEESKYFDYDMRHGYRENYKDAYATIEPRLRDNDLIVASVPAMAIFYLSSPHQLAYQDLPYFRTLRTAESRLEEKVFTMESRSGVDYGNVKLDGLNKHDYRWIKQQNRRTWFVVADSIWMPDLRAKLDPDVDVISLHRSSNGYTDKSVWVLLWTPKDWRPAR